MSKAAELAALIGSQTALSNRNLIINGAMQVAQRGTSQTNVGPNGSNEGFTVLDRFQISLSGDQVSTFSQSTDAPSGFSNSAKIEVTTADTSLAATQFWHLRYGFEGQDLQSIAKGTSDAKSFTVSFYVKSNKTGVYTVGLFDTDNNRQNALSYTINSSNTWERKSLTFNPDTTGAFTNDNNLSLRLNFALLGGADLKSGTFFNGTWGGDVDANAVDPNQVNFADTVGNEWYITGVQLEIGDVATPFEHRSYGDELARCQRYYWAIDADNHITDYPSFVASAYSSSQCNFQVSFPVQMRTVPSMTYNSGSAFYRFYRNASNDNFDTVQNDTVTQWHVNISSNGGLSHTAGTSGNVQIRIPSGGGFQADAEL